jgi:hypothetical protein
MTPSTQEKTSLLATKGYDEDAPSLEPADGNESDGNSSTTAGRDSVEVAHDAQEVLEEDYESDHNGGSVSTGARSILGRIFGRAQEAGYEEPMYQRRKPSRRHRERVRRGENQSEMMYEMEEGGEASQSPSPSRNSSELDLQKLQGLTRGKQVSYLVNRVHYSGRMLILSFRTDDSEYCDGSCYTEQSFPSSF